MTQIVLDAYVFDVDVEKTKHYYQTHSLCECDGCRNFYGQVRQVYPELAEFLQKFGADVEKPDETPWWAVDGRIEYTPFYTVIGTAAFSRACEINLGTMQLLITRGEDPLHYIPNEQKEPYFVIGVYNLDLPWVLDEPYPEEPEVEPVLSIFQKIKKLFRR